MPRVPSYDNFQVMPDGASSAMAAAPSGPNAAMIAGEQVQRAGQAVDAVNDASNRILLAMQEDANKTRVNDAMNQYVQQQTSARLEALQIRGRNALERPDNKSLVDEYGDRLSEAAKGLSGGLGNDAQRRAFTQNVAQLDTRFRAALGEHVVQQQSVFRKETQKSTLETAASQAQLLPFDPVVQAQSRAVIARTVDDIAKDNGMDDTTKALALTEAMTPMHMGVMRSMIAAGHANDAKAYYEQNSAGMTMQARAQMQERLKGATDAEVALKEGSRIAALFDYTQTGQAGKAVDALDVPADQKKAIRAEVEHRHAVMQSDATARNAALVGKLHEMVQRNVSVAELEKTPEFAEVRDKGAILEMARNKQYSDVLRANAGDARALQQMQRHESELRITQAASAMAYADPVVLAGTPREKLQELLPKLGLQWTKELLDRKDSMQRTGVREASMDFDDIKSVARDFFGIDAANLKTKEQKAAFLDFKSRAERLIAAEPDGKSMSRSEKYKRLADEAARTVTINPGIFSSNAEVPVMALDAKRLDQVVVPRSDQAKILDYLSRKRAEPGQGNNPLYAETVENIRRTYLANKSPAADLVVPQVDAFPKP